MKIKTFPLDYNSTQELIDSQIKNINSSIQNINIKSITAKDEFLVVLHDESSIPSKKVKIGIKDMLDEVTSIKNSTSLAVVEAEINSHDLIAVAHKDNFIIYIYQ